MIVNASGTMALSNLRWTDAGSLWAYEVGNPEPRQNRLSDAKWLTLVPGTDDHFAIVHHFEDGRVRLTSHSFRDISETISAIELRIEDVESGNVERAVARFTGEESAWSFLPRAYLIRPFEESLLLLVDWNLKATQIQPPFWYKESYDTIYQGILSVTEIPGSSSLIFSMQRDSGPVVYDPSARKIVRKLELGGASGAPQLFFRRDLPELWASDYDTIVRVDSRNWEVLGRLKLEEGQDGMVRTNIGKYYFGTDERLCLVARPHSGDVVGIDPSTFAVILRAQTGGQPEDVGLLSGGLAVARDLKTGQLLQGVLTPF
jgi:hypothetical protein